MSGASPPGNPSPGDNPTETVEYWLDNNLKELENKILPGLQQLLDRLGPAGFDNVKPTPEGALHTAIYELLRRDPGFAIEAWTLPDLSRFLSEAAKLVCRRFPQKRPPRDRLQQNVEDLASRRGEHRKKKGREQSGEEDG